MTPEAMIAADHYPACGTRNGDACSCAAIAAKTLARFEAQPNKPDVYVYRIRSTGETSAKFGACMVCAEYVSDVHLQVEGVTFMADHGDVEHLAVTHHECKTLFGHRECLVGARRGAA